MRANYHKEETKGSKILTEKFSAHQDLGSKGLATNSFASPLWFASRHLFICFSYPRTLLHAFVSYFTLLLLAFTFSLAPFFFLFLCSVLTRFHFVFSYNFCFLFFVLLFFILNLFLLCSYSSVVIKADLLLMCVLVWVCICGCMCVSIRGLGEGCVRGTKNNLSRRTHRPPPRPLPPLMGSE